MTRRFSFAASLLLVVLTSVLNAQWTTINQGLPQKVSPYALSIKNSTLFAACFQGLYYSADKGNTWQFKKIETNSIHPFFQNLNVEEHYMIVSGSNGSFISKDNGVTWGPFQYKDRQYSVDNIIVKGKELYIEDVDGIYLYDETSAKSRYISGGLQKGTYFDEEGETQTMSGIYATVMVGNTLYAGTSNGVSATNDKGVSWQSLNNGLPKGSKEVFQLQVVGSTIYATIHDKGAYFSENNGSSWAKLEGGIPKDAYIREIVVSGSTLFAAILKRGVFYSNDNGKTWTEMNEGFGKKENISSLLLDGTTLYAGVYDKGIYRCDISKYLK